jgi:hypothetical protein
MSDIVEQLREKSKWRPNDVHGDLHKAAADEIVRLRAIVRVNGLRWGHTHAEIDALIAPGGGGKTPKSAYVSPQAEGVTHSYEPLPSTEAAALFSEPARGASSSGGSSHDPAVSSGQEPQVTKNQDGTTTWTDNAGSETR